MPLIHGKADKNLTELASNKNALKRVIELRIARQSLYNIKNLSVIQLIEKCNEWNQIARDEAITTGTEHSLINYSFNPDTYGVYFDIPYSNMPVAVHLPDHLCNALMNTLNPQQYTIVTSKPHTPTILLGYMGDQDTVKDINKIYFSQKYDNNGRIDPYIRKLKKRVDDDIKL